VTSAVEGLPVLAQGSKDLFTWQLGCPRRLTMRKGSVGFVLAFWADWFNDEVERLDQPGEHPQSIDDGAYSPRKITGGTGWSKHATGGAMDLNWRKHPYNVRTIETFTPVQIAKIRTKLDKDTLVDGRPLIEWGGDWPSHAGSSAKTDAMHFQISSHFATAPIAACEVLARRWMRRTRGKAILALNPGQKAVILS
jgi:hypothetical protein